MAGVGVDGVLLSRGPGDRTGSEAEQFDAVARSEARALHEQRCGQVEGDGIRSRDEGADDEAFVEDG